MTAPLPDPMRSPGSLFVVGAIALVVGCSGWSTTKPVSGLPVVALPWVGGSTDASISGTVRDGAGRPIAVAQVCAWELAPERDTNEDRTPECTRAGADGHYTLPGLPAGTWRVQASAHDFHAEVLGPVVPLLAGQLRDAVDLVLADGGVALRGQVVGADGRPIAGAWVSNRSDSMYASTPDATGTYSDGEGRFTLWVQPGRQSLSADAPGFSATMTQVDTEAAPGQIVLTPAAELHGAVVDAVTGAPLAGVRVQAIVDRPMGVLESAGLAYTDAAGAFRITRLRPGTFRLRAQTGNRIGAGDRGFVLGVGETVVAPTLALSSAPAVRGQVVTADGEPCRHGSVVVGEQAVEAIGPDGEVFIPSIDPGEHSLEVRCHEHPILDSTPTLVVEHAPITGLRLVVSGDGFIDSGRTPPVHAGVLRGVVVDARGEPVVGAFVAVHTSDDMGPRGDGLATDTDGRFVIRDVPYGPQKISAQAPDQVNWGRHVSAPGTAIEVEPAGPPELRMTLPGLVKPVRGRVLRGGSPVAGAVVVAQVIDASETHPGWYQPLHWGWRFDHVTRSDGDGSFTLPRTFDASHYQLAAYPPGGGASPPSLAVGGVEVVLDVPVTGAIAGTIVGAPPGFGVRLARVGSDDRFARELRHSGGRWGFEGLPAGSYRIAAVAESGCTTSELTLAAGERREDVTLALDGAGGVRGQVLDGDTHEPVRGVEVYAVHADPEIAALAPRGVMTDVDGRFELRGLCSGKHDLGASVESDLPRAPAMVEAGHFTEVTLRVRGAADAGARAR